MVNPRAVCRPGNTRAVFCYCIVAGLLLSGSCFAEILDVPDGFETIQAAIDAAAAGDVIVIASGTYSEVLSVTKSITLRGSEGGETVIDGGGATWAIRGGTAAVTIERLSVRNAETGIHLYNADGSVVRYCRVSNNCCVNERAVGIHLEASNDCRIEGNAITHIDTWFCTQNDSDASGRPAMGILLTNVSGCVVTANAVNSITGGSGSTGPYNWWYGGSGGRGGPGYGVAFSGLIADSTLSRNHINTIRGGRGGNGSSGVSDGGSGGSGGSAYGLGSLREGAILLRCFCLNNVINEIAGRWGGDGAGGKRYAGSGGEGGSAHGVLVSGERSLFAHNTIADVHGGYGGSSGGCGAAGCAPAGSHGSAYGIRDESGGLDRFVNNIIHATAAPGSSELTRAGKGFGLHVAPMMGCSEDFNCYFNHKTGAVSGIGMGVSSFEADPMLFGSYHIHAHSPCIDAATTIELVDVDFEGHPRPYGDAPDIGAFEFSGVPTATVTPTATATPLFTWTPTSTRTITPTRTPTVTRTPTPTPLDLFVPQDFPTIQEAVDAAAVRNRIIVAAGTYYERIHFGGKDLILQSTNPDDPVTVASTVIDASGSGTVVTFSGSETSKCILSGFTITGGGAGGIIAGREGKQGFPTIRNNIIRDNASSNPGAGIYRSSGRIESNVILNNVSQLYGGGLAYCYGPVRNNVIANNSAPKGGGVYYCTNLSANTLYGNQATTGGAIASSHYYDITNCIIWGNSEPELEDVSRSRVTYSCIRSGTDLATCVFTDPLLVDPENGDFHLAPASPCIDAGKQVPGLLADSDGDPRGYNAFSGDRGDGSDFDIGADEFIGTAESNSPPARPVNVSPLPGSIQPRQGLNLFSSDFQDPDPGSSHLASQWQIADGTAFASPVHDSGRMLHSLLEYAVSETSLYPRRDYWWRVRHMDDRYVWSEWSVPTDFTTADPIALSVPGDYPTIQEAIDHAAPLDEVVVEPGTYYENVEIVTFPLVLRSTDPLDPEIARTTIIDGSQADHVISISRRAAGTEIAGLTLIHGVSSAGGGIFADGSAIIRNNRIINNTAESYWDQYYHSYQYGYGGGVAIWSGIVENNIIAGNHAEDAGGIFVNFWSREQTDIRNNVVYGNRIGMRTVPEDGITVYSTGIRGGYADICNNIVWNNSVTGYYGYPSEAIRSTYPPRYCCIQDWDGGGIGNVSDHPALREPENGDYHLCSVSPCIDSGTDVEGLLTDFEGDSRPYGARFDMGADEFIGAAAVSLPPDAPTNLFPADGSTGIATDTVLVCSAFSDPNPDTLHGASHWQMDDDSDFSSPAFDSGVDTANLTSITIPLWRLLAGRTYHWRVKHIDTVDLAGPWSEPTSFSTRARKELEVPSGFPTIQDALNAALPGDVVIVAPRNYVGCLTMPAFDITLRSENPEDWETVAATILDASGKGPVITFHGRESSECVLEGLTLTGGHAAGGHGGGIRGNGCGATIRHNLILGNWADRYGGGIMDCDGLIESNILMANKAQQGAGAHSCGGKIYGNLIRENTASNAGGGLANCMGLITANRIYDCTGGYGGGGIYRCNGIISGNVIAGNSGYGLADSSGIILNNTICYNRDGGGIWSNGTIRNCIVWGNTPYETRGTIPGFSCVKGWIVGHGNIGGDPMFADPSAGDFHLRRGSPCIDAGIDVGDIGPDMDGQPRDFGMGIDMGADEFAPLPPEGIFEIANTWGRSFLLTPSDRNADGSVDGEDLYPLMRERR